MSLIRLMIGILLLPVCVATSQIALAIAKTVHTESSAVVPPPALALCGGYILWLVVYFTLPRPVRTYVLAHELTHALWGALMGARVSRLSVSKTKGSVTLSKTNFLITLAPYFFPLYTVLVVIGYYVTSIFYDVTRYDLWWLGLVGFTWGFHFTFTISSLMQKQPDIQAYGHFFSYTTIYILNVLGIALWIVLVSSPTLEDFVGIGGYFVANMWHVVCDGTYELWNFINR
jgi:hypothetical protein